MIGVVRDQSFEVVTEDEGTQKSVHLIENIYILFRA